MLGRVSMGVMSALCVAACDSGAVVVSDAHAPDVSPTRDTDEPRELERSATFLITHLELQRGPDQGGDVIGLDLDGRVSGGDTAASDCRDRHPDRRSPLGLSGVDNQLVVGVVPMILEFAPSLDLERGLDEPIVLGDRRGRHRRGRPRRRDRRGVHDRRHLRHRRHPHADDHASRPQHAARVLRDVDGSVSVARGPFRVRSVLFGAERRGHTRVRSAAVKP